jgi:hypothetical protein
VLAVGFLLAALAGFGISDLLSSDDMTLVTNPGTDQMQVIVKQGSEVQTLDVEAASQVSGVGTLIGQFYRLEDGTTVYVPAGAAPPASTTTGGTTTDQGVTAPEDTATGVEPAPEAPPMPAPGDDAVSDGSIPAAPPAKKGSIDTTP